MGQSVAESICYYLRGVVVVQCLNKPYTFKPHFNVWVILRNQKRGKLQIKVNDKLNLSPITTNNGVSIQYGTLLCFNDLAIIQSQCQYPQTVEVISKSILKKDVTHCQYNTWWFCLMKMARSPFLHLL